MKKPYMKASAAKRSVLQAVTAEKPVISLVRQI